VARPSRLVVTHLQAGTDPHEVFTVLRRYHSGDLVLAVDGWNVEV